MHPTEIENVLLQLDNVKDVTVRGQPNPITGEVVAAKITALVQEDPDALKRRDPRILPRASRALQDACRHRCRRGRSLRCTFQEIARRPLICVTPERSLPDSSTQRRGLGQTHATDKKGRAG